MLFKLTDSHFLKFFRVSNLPNDNLKNRMKLTAAHSEVSKSLIASRSEKLHHVHKSQPVVNNSDYCDSSINTGASSKHMIAFTEDSLHQNK